MYRVARFMIEQSSFLKYFNPLFQYTITREAHCHERL